MPVDPATEDEALHRFLTWEDKRGLMPILEAMAVTGRVALIGLVVATVLGMAIAIVMNLSKGFERAIFPYAVVIQPVPILALVPLLLLCFFLGREAVIGLATLLAENHRFPRACTFGELVHSCSE